MKPVIPGTSLAIPPDQFPAAEVDVPPSDDEQVAVLAGGCFWCVEAVYDQLDGVREVTSGYAGGTEETANYKAVSRGDTRHAEAVRITFDSRRISYGDLLKVFFSVAHDPTQRNRQGNDVGPQYRSAIFPADEQQRRAAETYIAQLEAARAFIKPIVTTIEPLQGFYEAEDYHQGYAARNPHQPYVAFVSAPKVRKVREYYRDRLR